MKTLMKENEEKNINNTDEESFIYGRTILFLIIQFFNYVYLGICVCIIFN